jgi:phosphoserine phosphatase RsbU/P
VPRTLVVDDDPLTEPLFRKHLSRLRAQRQDQFIFACSDEDALEILEAGAEFDIALVAIDRERVSGMGLFQKLKNRSLRVPRIALTSGEDLSVIRKAMNSGAADFLTKPFSFKDFTITINRVIRVVERRRRNWRERAEFSALRREVDIAGDIQQKILPQSYPERPGLDVYGSMKPAKMMGGDFFDVFEVDANRVGFVMADVSGKGVPAAFFMAVARTLLRSIAMGGAGPAECLAYVNRLLCGYHIPGMFVSVVYGTLNPSTGDICYANGGHQPPYVGNKSGDRLRLLEGGGGTVLGILDDMEYTEDTAMLAKGEFLYLYTDGVTEAFNLDREQFSEERVEESLSRHGGQDAKSLIEAVVRDVEAFSAPAEQHDDMTSLVVRRV